MIDWIPPLVATILGLIGSAVFLGCFAYANIAKPFDPLIFNIGNLVGALLLLISLSVHFNLAAFVLEAAWAVIATWGIARALRQRKAAP